MKRPLRTMVLVAVGALPIIPAPVVAQGYPIDCAILLCLSGGWPASVPCTRAKAEFIRRITPWPVEPPLQIWRCPMSVDYAPAPIRDELHRLYEAGVVESRTQSWANAGVSPPQATRGVIGDAVLPDEVRLMLAQAVGTGADIDISDDVFDFIRSIKVWDVQHYSFRERNRDERCEERSLINLGTYDSSGQFRWNRSNPAAVPTWLIPTRTCSEVNDVRAVGVEWHDYQGNFGYELVRY